MDYKRINHTINLIQRNVEPDSVCFLIIDDTLSKKDKSTRKIKGLDCYHSHSDGEITWSHCIVSSHYKVFEYYAPLDFKLYFRKQFFGNKSRKLFKSKHELALNLISEFIPAIEVTRLLIDVWYTSGKVMLHALSKGYHTIGRVKSNFVIYPGGIKTNVKKFSTYVCKDDT